MGQKYAAGERALSWYTANLLSALPNDDLDYEVYANKLTGQPYTSRVGENTQIIRCWKLSALSVFQIASQIAKSKPDLVHVQHEIFQFGKGIFALITPLLFVAIKAMQIPSVVTLHAVPPLSKIDVSFMRKYGSRIPPLLVRIAFWSVIWSIVLLSDRVVVLGEEFAQILVKEYLLSRQKIVVIPHGIEMRDDNIDREKAKTKLGLRNKLVILFFGNLTGYKGLEILIDSMGNLEKIHHNLALVIAGGDTPGLKVAGEQAYSDRLKQRAQGISPNIRFTGFVEEIDIALYFGAADLLVLPYTMVMSSGGPLALAVSYNTPFLVSTALATVVDLDDAIFEPTVHSLVEKIDRFINNDDMRREIIDYELKLRSERSWSHIGEQTTKLYRDCL